jgi:hypothetical protein
MKSTFAQFVNSAFLMLIIALIQTKGKFENFMAPGGFIGNIYGMLVTMAIYNPLRTLYQSFGVGKRYIIWYRKRQDKRGKRCPLTKKEIFALHEGYDLKPAAVVSQFMNMIFLALFMGPILPMSVPICAISSFITYQVNKFVLLRTARRPQMLGANLIAYFINYMPYHIGW